MRLKISRISLFLLMIIYKQLIVSSNFPWKTTNKLYTRGSQTFRIVNGDRAELGDIPYQVGILNKITKELFCGGTIIDAEIVLTAAHCLPFNLLVQEYEIRAGHVTIDDPNIMSYSILKFIRHLQFDPELRVHDIGLIRINGQFYTGKITSRDANNLISPALLPNSDSFEDITKPYLISGWGYRNFEATRTEKNLRFAEVYYVNRDACNNKFKPWNAAVYDGMICAVGKLDNNTMVDACTGDSGGPMVYYDTTKLDQLPVIVGITSWGADCATPDVPGVYTSVTYYMNWIVAQTRNLQQGRDNSNAADRDDFDLNDGKPYYGGESAGGGGGGGGESIGGGRGNPLYPADETNTNRASFYQQSILIIIIENLIKLIIFL